MLTFYRIKARYVHQIFRHYLFKTIYKGSDANIKLAF